MVPVEIDRLNNFVREGEIEEAVYFNILADIPSGPLAFVVSRAANKSHTSDSEQRNSSGQLKLEPIGVD
jgi:hypothetical protein